MSRISIQASKEQTAIDSMNQTVRLKTQRSSPSLDKLASRNPLVGFSDADRVSVSMADPQKGVSITASEILKRINERLELEGVEPITNSTVGDYSPEATAQRIVSGVTALYDVFQRQNASLEPDETLTRFMEAVGRGVDEGYRDAFKILEALGALEVSGVKDGIETTLKLVKSGLSDFETKERERISQERGPSNNAEPAQSTP